MKLTRLQNSVHVLPFSSKWPLLYHVVSSFFIKQNVIQSIFLIKMKLALPVVHLLFASTMPDVFFALNDVNMY